MYQSFLFMKISHFFVTNLKKRIFVACVCTKYWDVLSNVHKITGNLTSAYLTHHLTSMISDACQHFNKKIVNSVNT